MTRLRAALSAIAITAVACGGSGSDRSDATTTTHRTSTTTERADRGVEQLTVEVVARHPHDRAAFTEGLVFAADGTLYESLGLEGRSSVRAVDPSTGEVTDERALRPDQFGEGLATGPDGLVHLTWKNGVALEWSTDPLASKGSVGYEGEGWGLTSDGHTFLQSDGSSSLTERGLDTFDVTRKIAITLDGRPVTQLNELEWVGDVVYANVWHSDEIMRIDPESGRVTGVIDASNLWRGADRTSEMTLNGIGHRRGDPADRLWLTGKNWPEMFEVKVVPA